MFILPNGNLLNPNDYEMKVGLSKDEMTHGAFLLYIVDSIMQALNFDTSYSSAVSDYILEEVTQRLGWVRVNSGSNSVEDRCYIVIPSQSGKRPTSAQYEKLKDYIYYFLGRDKEFYVDISGTNGGIVKSFEYGSPISVDLILLDIKDWFKDN